MFSFRTTPIEEQLDKSLTEGNVGCFCTQNSWDSDKGLYIYDIFGERGNLAKIFSPLDTELSTGGSSIEFTREDLEDLNAVVVEIQDVGSRYFGYTKDFFRLMCEMKEMGDSAPSLYVIDHINPAGRVVEGSMPSGDVEDYVPKVAHRHGLTLGELANLYHNEIGAKFPLHVISATVCETGKKLMPWTIAPSSDIPGLFTCDMYSGGGLWDFTNISPGTGTARPYEYIGAPFVKTDRYEPLPLPSGVLMRPASFTPYKGIYAGQKCYGYQIILEPGAEYHSFLHTLHLMRYFKERYDCFGFSDEFAQRLADPVIMDYLEGKVESDVLRDHVKVEEQKWIRKAKKYLLYEDQVYRVK